MFVPHVVIARKHAKRSGRSGRPVAPHVAVAVVFGVLAPLFGYLLDGVHSGAVAAGVVIALLAAGAGFALARVIGRQGRI